MWRGPDGAVKASVKAAEGGPTRYFPNLEALVHYLEQAQEKIEEIPLPSQGLR